MAQKTRRGPGPVEPKKPPQDTPHPEEQQPPRELNPDEQRESNLGQERDWDIPADPSEEEDTE